MSQHNLFDEVLVDDEFDNELRLQREREERFHRSLVQDSMDKVVDKRRGGKVNMRTPKGKSTTEIQQKVIESVVARLKATNCVFKIITAGGEEIVHDPDNTLNKRKVKINRDELPYKRGDLMKHYEPYVRDLQVGEVAEIPFNEEMTCLAIQSSLTARLSTWWGKGSYATSRNDKTQKLEVIRFA